MIFWMNILVIIGKMSIFAKCWVSKMRPVTRKKRSVFVFCYIFGLRVVR